MKQLWMAALAALCLTGCASYQGSPGDDTDIDTAQDRRTENKAADNLPDISRQNSPTAPHTRGNGSLNFSRPFGHQRRPAQVRPARVDNSLFRIGTAGALC